ncbi:Putative redox protein fmp46, mitochondrial [Tolypocladium paradoxum]|uniref:Redox protein fmp46, mitochondrial n=1 Tax=Tolypocladium paradoxum TaxID=94208 RepID=A0A2S4L3A5_9HYPO|nr:Putative redox protein fmp46, mitochondrial [Tolypocladium paradoxum]
MPEEPHLTQHNPSSLSINLLPSIHAAAIAFKMFGFTQRKTLDIVTVFHKASSPASTRVVNLLKQMSANAQAGATMDQASDTTSQTNARRDPFELNITEEPPTAEQVQTILEYVGKGVISQVVKGAHDQKDALKRFKQNQDNFLRPVTVDWSNGKAIAGDNESEILKLLNEQK